MPDIAMCFGEGCVVKETCHRHIAKPSLRQSYFAKPPYQEKDGKQHCEHYWEAKYAKNKETTTKEE